MYVRIQTPLVEDNTVIVSSDESEESDEDSPPRALVLVCTLALAWVQGYTCTCFCCTKCENVSIFIQPTLEQRQEAVRQQGQASEASLRADREVVCSI